MFSNHSIFFRLININKLMRYKSICFQQFLVNYSHSSGFRFYKTIIVILEMLKKQTKIAEKKLYLTLVNCWINIKVLLNGSTIIETAEIAIGPLSEDTQEARNEHVRAYQGV